LAAGYASRKGVTAPGNGVSSGPAATTGPGGAAVAGAVSVVSSGVERTPQIHAEKKVFNWHPLRSFSLPTPSLTDGTPAVPSGSCL